MYRRIHIIGGPGSGKTTLARRLAAQLSTTAYDLDEVGYEGGAGPKRSLADRVADIEQILRQQAWVTEGAFLWWVDPLLREADCVIWLDISWPLAAWRIVSRHMRLSLTRTNRHPGWLRLLGFLRWARRYYLSQRVVPPTSPDDDGATNRAATAQYLAAFEDKLIRCPDSAAVEKLLARIQMQKL